MTRAHANQHRPWIPLADRRAQGKSHRRRVPRSAHAAWKPAKNRTDPVAFLEASSKGRVRELIPIRYGRMLPSPFTFLRGSAAQMAFDLSATPVTGIHVQLCGDCHLMNFGGFGTPERQFIFDLTDFDETLPGPWEWDVKRLAASVICAGRAIGISDRNCRDASLASLRSYRERMHEFAELTTLEVWHTRIPGHALLELSDGKSQGPGGKIQPRTATDLFPRITEVVDGRRRFQDNPPLVYHPPHGDPFGPEMHRFLTRYAESLQDDRRALLHRYHLLDMAMKVVGVGSVGTRCLILLMMADDNDPLLLQYKEAGPSVLEAYLEKSKYHSHGHRVVTGQRLMQSASDRFLGWSTDESGRDFYFRQLRDMKTTVRVDAMTASQLTEYVTLCGWALARGHAKSGDAAQISGYLGKGDAFDKAVTEFALLYADQTERDHEAMQKAVKAGRLVAHTERP